MGVVLACTDVTVIAGDLLASCPAASLVWIDSAVYTSASLSTDDIANLASAALVLFAIAYGFKVVRKALLR